MLKNFVNELTQKDYDKASDLEKRIKNLLNLIPRGGFLNPEEEKKFWKEINKLQKEREKIIER